MVTKRAELLRELAQSPEEIEITGKYADSMLKKYCTALVAEPIPEDVQILPLPRLGIGTVLQNYGIKEYRKGKTLILEKKRIEFGGDGESQCRRTGDEQ